MNLSSFGKKGSATIVEGIDPEKLANFLGENIDVDGKLYHLVSFINCDNIISLFLSYPKKCYICGLERCPKICREKKQSNCWKDLCNVYSEML